MEVTLVQFAADIDSAVNDSTVDRLLQQIEGPTDLVVLPEAAMHDLGSASHDLTGHAQSLDGPFVSRLAAHARRLNAHIVAGMFEATDSLPFNTLVVVGPDGQLAGSYRKIHLYDSFGYRESDRLAAGQLEPVVLDIRGVQVGLMTCYDLRFPELARMLTDVGAELLVVPAAWVVGDHKVEHWRTLLRARAIENVCWVAGVGQSGPRYCGHSLVTDPWGTIVEEAHAEETVVRLSIDPMLVAKARQVNPSLANRRITVR